MRKMKRLFDEFPEKVLPHITSHVTRNIAIKYLSLAKVIPGRGKGIKMNGNKYKIVSNAVS